MKELHLVEEELFRRLNNVVVSFSKGSFLKLVFVSLAFPEGTVEQFVLLLREQCRIEECCLAELMKKRLIVENRCRAEEKDQTRKEGKQVSA